MEPGWTGKLETFVPPFWRDGINGHHILQKWDPWHKNTPLKFLSNLIEENLFHSLWSSQPLGEVRHQIFLSFVYTKFCHLIACKFRFSSIALSKENWPTSLPADTATRGKETRSSREEDYKQKLNIKGSDDTAMFHRPQIEETLIFLSHLVTFSHSLFFNLGPTKGPGQRYQLPVLKDCWPYVMFHNSVIMTRNWHGFDFT